MSEFLYSVEREYDVPVDVLWHAWTDAAALERWYCPTELSNVPGSVVSEPRVGGWWTVAVDASKFGHIAYFYGTYSVVEPNAKLVHSMSYTQSVDEFAARDLAAPSHEVVIEFEARGDRAWVKFSQFGELPEGQAPRAQAGMESYFDNLAAFLRG